jgi:hypothetical protein
MVSFFGDYDTTETVVIPFNSFTSDDPSASVTMTNLIATDVEIYKDGSLTQRNSATHSGIVVDIDVDAVAGAHWITIDLSDNDDAGFYANGSRYQVMIVGTTIDGGTVNAWIGAFSIGCTLRPTTAGRTLDVNATGEAGLDLDNTSGTISAAQLAADCITEAKIADDAIAAEHIATGAIVAATFAAGAIDAAAIANNAIDAATFAADVDAEILSYIVDDATKIDASALNTAATAVGSDGTGLTEAGGTGDQLTAVAQADTMEGFFQITLRSDAAITTDRAAILTLVNANEGSGAGDYAATTESQEALRDNVALASVCTEGRLAQLDAANLPSDVDDILVDTNSLNDTKIPQTLNLTASGNIGIDWANVENPTTAVDLSGTDIQLCDTTTTNTDMVGTDNAALASVCTEARLAELDAANLPADISGLNDPTAAAIADAVWDEAATGHTDAGKAGAQLWTDIDAILDDTDLIDDGASGLAKIATDVAAILLDTAVIGAAGAGLTEAGGTGDHLTALPWNAAWDTEVESEVNDAIDTAISELGVGVPTSTPTLRTAIMLMYMALRNTTNVKTSYTTDAMEVSNDVGTVIAHKDVTDDGSDYSEAKMQSGASS